MWIKKRLNFGIRLLLMLLILTVVLIQTRRKTQENFSDAAPGCRLKGPGTLICDCHLVHDIPAMNSDSTVNVVIEIPAGTRAKWEVDKASGHLKWEKRGEDFRNVPYLGYPGNYGMIPQTLLAESRGGDGDPMDVLVLGKPVHRGTILRVKIVGCLKLLDNGEIDDKMLAVCPEDVLDCCETLEQFKARFPGILSIVETWFSHYKYKGRMESLGFIGASEAWEKIQAAAEAYQSQAFRENGNEK